MCLLLKLLPIFIVWVIMGLGLPFYFYSIYVGTKWLRENDVDLWQEAGNFSLLLNNSISSGSKFNRWLYRNRHRAIPDARVVKHLTFARNFGFLGYLFLVLLVVTPIVPCD